ncbi:hypothetical protein HYH03_007452 [Edaphochlamys debaryana]|uniref:Guanylate cyclase domain-containing protein n=1 Tax=Edaphochlamys debaryana TaxID=47281 RepID=A0A835Y1Y5_9CHLO|nr:hypothetical protein HYH03_007452 [Edaphochlamys debaryana]|eukprot:KAG2494400.1 hypothetical protein HYH03_007452 [Edaphochlamys debaryana]
MTNNQTNRQTDPSQLQAHAAGNHTWLEQLNTSATAGAPLPTSLTVPPPGAEGGPPAAPLLLLYRRDWWERLAAEAGAASAPLPPTWPLLAGLLSSLLNKDLDGDGRADHVLCADLMPGCKGGAVLAAIWASLAQTQGTSQGLWFNATDLSPALDGPALPAALRLYAALAASNAAPFTPGGPGVSGSRVGTAPEELLAAGGAVDASGAPLCGAVNPLFASGRCLLTIDWAPAAMRLSGEDVSGKLGAALLPGSAVVVSTAPNGSAPSQQLQPCSPLRCPHADAHGEGELSALAAVMRPGPQQSVAGLAPVLVNRAPLMGEAGNIWRLATGPGSERTMLVGEFLRLVGFQLGLKYGTLLASLSGDTSSAATALGEATADVAAVSQAINASTRHPNMAVDILLPYSSAYRSVVDELAVRALSAVPEVEGTPALDMYGTLVRTAAAQFYNISAAFPYPAILRALYWHSIGFAPTHSVKPPGPGAATTLALTDVQNSTLLWEVFAAELMDECMAIHHGVMRQAIELNAGYEVFTEGDAFTVAFHGPDDALAFAMDLQMALLTADWPADLLDHPDGREVWARRSTHLPQPPTPVPGSPMVPMSPTPLGPGTSGRMSPLAAAGGMSRLAAGGRRLRHLLLAGMPYVVPEPYSSPKPSASGISPGLVADPGSGHQRPSSSHVLLSGAKLSSGGSAAPFSDSQLSPLPGTRMQLRQEAAPRPAVQTSSSLGRGAEGASPLASSLALLSVQRSHKGLRQRPDRPLLRSGSGSAGLSYLGRSRRGRSSLDRSRVPSTSTVASPTQATAYLASCLGAPWTPQAAGQAPAAPAPRSAEEQPSSGRVVAGDAAHVGSAAVWDGEAVQIKALQPGRLARGGGSRTAPQSWLSDLGAPGEARAVLGRAWTERRSSPYEAHAGLAGSKHTPSKTRASAWSPVRIAASGQTHQPLSPPLLRRSSSGGAAGGDGSLHGPALTPTDRPRRRSSMDSPWAARRAAHSGLQPHGAPAADAAEQPLAAAAPLLPSRDANPGAPKAGTSDDVGHKLQPATTTAQAASHAPPGMGPLGAQGAEEEGEAGPREQGRDESGGHWPVPMPYLQSCPYTSSDEGSGGVGCSDDSVVQAGSPRRRHGAVVLQPSGLRGRAETVQGVTASGPHAIAKARKGAESAADAESSAAMGSAPLLRLAAGPSPHPVSQGTNARRTTPSYLPAAADGTPAGSIPGETSTARKAELVARASLASNVVRNRQASRAHASAAANMVDAAGLEGLMDEGADEWRNVVTWRDAMEEDREERTTGNRSQARAKAAGGPAVGPTSAGNAADGVLPGLLWRGLPGGARRQLLRNSSLQRDTAGPVVSSSSNVHEGEVVTSSDRRKREFTRLLNPSPAGPKAKAAAGPEEETQHSSPLSFFTGFTLHPSGGAPSDQPSRAPAFSRLRKGKTLVIPDEGSPADDPAAATRPLGSAGAPTPAGSAAQTAGSGASGPLRPRRTNDPPQVTSLSPPGVSADGGSPADASPHGGDSRLSTVGASGLLSRLGNAIRNAMTSGRLPILADAIDVEQGVLSSRGLSRSSAKLFPAAHAGACGTQEPGPEAAGTQRPPEASHKLGEPDDHSALLEGGLMFLGGGEMDAEGDDHAHVSSRGHATLGAEQQAASSAGVSQATAGATTGSPFAIAPPSAGPSPKGSTRVTLVGLVSARETACSGASPESATVATSLPPQSLLQTGDVLLEAIAQAEGPPQAPQVDQPLSPQLGPAVTQVLRPRSEYQHPQQEPSRQWSSSRGGVPWTRARSCSRAGSNLAEPNPALANVFSAMLDARGSNQRASEHASNTRMLAGANSVLTQQRTSLLPSQAGNGQNCPPSMALGDGLFAALFRDVNCAALAGDNAAAAGLGSFRLQSRNDIGGWLPRAVATVASALQLLYEQISPADLANLDSNEPPLGCEGEAVPAGEPELVLRGLRIRVGLHSGPGASEVELCLVDGVEVARYTGDFLATAKAIGDAAVGGMTVLSGAAFRAYQQLRQRARMPDIMLMHVGDHVVRQLRNDDQSVHGKAQLPRSVYPAAPSRELFAAVCPGLLARLALLPSPVRTQQEVVPGCLSAPAGEVAPVFCNVLGVESLLSWEKVVQERAGNFRSASKGHQPFGPTASSNPDGPSSRGFMVHTALQLLRDAVTETVSRHGGYLVASSSDGGHWVLVFGSAEQAVLWGLEMLEAMLAADWPAGFLEHELTEEEWKDGVLVKRGLRLRIGIDYGRAMVRLVPRTGRLDYVGRPMNRAARIAAKAKAATVLASDAVWNSVRPALGSVVDGRSLGQVQLKGVREPLELWALKSAEQ